MKKKTGDPQSVFSEPQFHSIPSPKTDMGQPPMDSIWMEPIQTGENQTKGGTLYSDWYLDQKRKQAGYTPWLRMLFLSLFAGPLAIFTALFTSNPGSGILLYVVAGPLIEEVGKVLLPLMVIENNPAKFTLRFQVIFCATAGGLVFSVIENLIYLNIYFPDAGEALIHWRWTVCVLLHTGCSFIAGCGIAKTWREADRNLKPAKIETAIPMLIAAVAVHGVYNLAATLLNPFFD